MVTNAKFQYYRHNYGLVCMTGLLGCRWHRYKQSTRENRKRDFLSFTVILLTFLFSIFAFYSVLILNNDFFDFNWWIYSLVKTWTPWYTILLAVTSVIFFYFIILMLLALGHICHGHQLYIHPVHTVISVLVVAFFIFLCWILHDMSKDTLILLSLKIMGPFLQIGVVIFMTCLTWVIARQWLTLSKTGPKLLWLFIYLSVMICLYISPVFIDSPCVIATGQLPNKPQLFAHRGASGIAPENTMIAFQIANKYNIIGIQTRVYISADGVPFLLHDVTLERTTNIVDIFPEFASKDASYFNISQIRQLNAGRWFIETDPFGYVNDLTESEVRTYSNQSVPTLLELATLMNQTRGNLMLDFQRPPKNHTHYHSFFNIIIDVLKQSGMPLNKVWVMKSQIDETMIEKVTVAWDEYYVPVFSLRSQNISTVNLPYSELTQDMNNEYSSANVTTNIYTVNTAWFFSLYWCMGVTSVTSNKCNILHDLPEPVWYMPPQSYLILWVTIDVLSAAIVLTTFIVQRVKLYGTKFSPETLSLNTARTNPKSSPSRRAMKERLLMKEVTADIIELEPENGEAGIESQYTVGSMDGRIMANKYHSNSNRMQTEARVEF
ncbi:hypothetical protein ScPMuIL_018812 [Solemya velum]